MVPEISIIFWSYNQADYISCAIDSVLSQSFSNWELLVVDDGSTDDSQGIIRTYCELDARIKSLCSPTNMGAPASFNRGVLNSLGRYTTLLMADDFWDPTFLEIMRSEMVKDEALTFVACRTSVVDDRERLLYLFPQFKHSRIQGGLRTLLSNEIFFHFGSLLWRSRSDLRLLDNEGDYWVIFKLLSAEGSKFLYVNNLLSYWRRSGGTSSDFGSDKLLNEHQIMALLAWVQIGYNDNNRKAAAQGLLKKLKYLAQLVDREA